MHWKSWLPGKRRRCVLGFDVGLTSCRLVVLSGSQSHPDMVCCAEQLQFPADDWVTQGHVWHAEELGHWLRLHLQQGGYDVEGMYVCLEDACISHHRVTLPAELSDDDVTFQVLAEVQALLGVSAADLSIDFGLESASAESVSESDVRHLVYRAAAVQRFRVEALQRAAKAAHIKLCAVECRSEAVRRTQGPGVLALLPAAGVAMALQCDAAFGLALGAWGSRAFNFLPHRAMADIALRQAWWLGIVACVVGGAFLATGFALVMASSTTLTLGAAANRGAIAASHNSAQTAHTQAQLEQKQLEQHTQWRQTQQLLNLQTVQWVRVLDQGSQGVSVIHVEQQGARWQVQGEALSSVHATQVVQQLAALAIWTKPPALSQLQIKTAPLTTGLPVWQFRIEAELKGAV